MVTNRQGTEENRTDQQMTEQNRPGQLNKTEQTRDAFTICPLRKKQNNKHNDN